MSNLSLRNCFSAVYLPWIVLVVLGGHWLYFVSNYSVDVLFHDQWDLYNPMFGESGFFEAFFYQHGPHRQGVGGVLTYYLARGTGFSVIAESYMIASFLVFSAALCLSLKRRLFSAASIWDLSIPLIVLNPVQVGTVIMVPNISHSVLPLFFLFCVGHCWISRNSTVRFAAASAIAALSLFTGFGIFVYIGFAVLFLSDWIMSIRSDWRSDLPFRGFALIVLILAAIIFSTEYRWDPANDEMVFPHEPWSDYVVFVNYMFGRFIFISKVARPYLGMVLLIGSLAVCVYTACRFFLNSKSRVFSIALLALSTSFGFIAMAAIGRVSLGVDGGGSSRYFTLVTPIVVSVYFILSEIVSEQSKRAILLFAGFSLLVGISYVSNTVYADHKLSPVMEGKQRWIESYGELRETAMANVQSDFSIYPDPLAIESRIRFLEDSQLSAFRD